MRLCQSFAAMSIAVEARKWKPSLKQKLLAKNDLNALMINDIAYDESYLNYLSDNGIDVSAYPKGKEQRVLVCKKKFFKRQNKKMFMISNLERSQRSQIWR